MNEEEQVQSLIACECAIWDEQRVIPVIPCEDELVHTNEQPFCSDMMCPCHEDRELMEAYIHRPWLDGLSSKESESLLYRGRQV